MGGAAAFVLSAFLRCQLGGVSCTVSAMPVRVRRGRSPSLSHLDAGRRYFLAGDAVFFAEFTGFLLDFVGAVARRETTALRMFSLSRLSSSAVSTVSSHATSGTAFLVSLVNQGT